jgi:hypothetical protein
MAQAFCHVPQVKKTCDTLDKHRNVPKPKGTLHPTG